MCAGDDDDDDERKEKEKQGKAMRDLACVVNVGKTRSEGGCGAPECVKSMWAVF